MYLYTQKTRKRMILIADSGGTKTDWLVADNGKKIAKITTGGLNPIHHEEVEMSELIRRELLPELGGESPDAVYFYGSGCNEYMVGKMQTTLASVFPGCTGFEVYGDLLAAARAVCGKSQGIACIMGTGANSCLYDGERIVENTPPLGYILGDEGSGAVLGKLFINAIFKGLLPAHIKEAWLAETGLSYPIIINKVYMEPLANRFLASISPFIAKHLSCGQLREMVVGNFREHFRRNVNRYGRPDLPVGAVGSIAYYYRDLLAEAAAAEGYTLAKVMRSPLDSLLHYHSISS